MLLLKVPSLAEGVVAAGNVAVRVGVQYCNGGLNFLFKFTVYLLIKLHRFK